MKKQFSLFDGIDIFPKPLTHLYELYKINTYVDGTTWFYQKELIDFKTVYTNLGMFKYFLDLIYTSFDHEIRARNASLYYYLMQYKDDDLIERLEKSQAYLKYKSLLNFRYDKIVEFFKEQNELNLLIEFVNILIKRFNKNTIINNENDLLKYFKKWDFHFKDSVKKSYRKMLKIVYEVNIDKNKIEENFTCGSELITPLFFEKSDITPFLYNLIKIRCLFY